MEAAVRFVKERKSKEKHVSASARSSDEESGVELEGTSNQSNKRSSSWRFAAMFTKSQSNAKPDKGMPSRADPFCVWYRFLQQRARDELKARVRNVVNFSVYWYARKSF